MPDRDAAWAAIKFLRHGPSAYRCAVTMADLERGAFSDEGPWVMPEDAMVWQRGIGELRLRVAAQVPELVRRRRVPPIQRAAITGWRLGGALLGWKLIDQRRTPDTARAGLSRRLRVAFAKLGPTYIKLGQILSSGEGIFPEELVKEFRYLRDRVPAESFEAVRRVVEAELGKPLEAVFDDFSIEPLAAASIAQVHTATLKTGESVVVKVQRPTVSELVQKDLAAMAWISPVLVGRIPISALANPPALVDLFAETIVEELDFRLEAQNMLDVARVLVATGQRSIVIPRPHPVLVTRRMLVMERLDGFSFEDVDGMKAAGVDTEAVVRAIMVSFLEGAILYGVFHGDLHGGNLFVRRDGRVALLDFGITGRLDEKRRLAFLRLIVGATMNDLNGQLGALIDLGALPHGTDIPDLIKDLGLDGPPIDPLAITPEQLLEEMREVVKKLLGYGARLPKELMLFIKDLLFLDAALATLAPDVDIFGEIAHVAEHMATRHGESIAAQIGLEPGEFEIDLTGVKNSFGVGEGVQAITHRELQERRQIMQKRMEAHAKETKRKK
ncbi:MAG: AarF/ABC1/UbiB kinase family protein [Actinobacteria bacterium]|nr:AarF/ABC1/UbiB kinase family protein [Actinomycetota bacterium]